MRASKANVPLLVTIMCWPAGDDTTTNPTSKSDVSCLHSTCNFDSPQKYISVKEQEEWRKAWHLMGGSMHSTREVVSQCMMLMKNAICGCAIDHARCGCAMYQTVNLNMSVCTQRGSVLHLAHLAFLMRLYCSLDSHAFTCRAVVRRGELTCGLCMLLCFRVSFW